MVIVFVCCFIYVQTGGLYWDVPAGRRDGRISRASETVDLPPPFGDLDLITRAFLKKGLTQREMVALVGKRFCFQFLFPNVITIFTSILLANSPRLLILGLLILSVLIPKSNETLCYDAGAHTIGRSHCSSFSNRLYNFSATNSQDPTLDPFYAAQLKQECPRGHGGNVDPNLVVEMNFSPALMDPSYFADVLHQRGLFTSDQTLTTSQQTTDQATLYAGNGLIWQQDFVSAMIKMSEIQVLTGTAGEIRSNCRRINP